MIAAGVKEPETVGVIADPAGMIELERLAVAESDIAWKVGEEPKLNTAFAERETVTGEPEPLKACTFPLKAVVAGTNLIFTAERFCAAEAVNGSIA